MIMTVSPATRPMLRPFFMKKRLTYLSNPLHNQNNYIHINESILQSIAFSFVSLYLNFLTDTADPWCPGIGQSCYDVLC